MYCVLSTETPFVFITDERQDVAECIWSGRSIEPDETAVSLASLSSRGIGNVWVRLGCVEALRQSLPKMAEQQGELRRDGQSIIERRSPERERVGCCVCGDSVKDCDVIMFDQNYAGMSVGEGYVCCHIDCAQELADILGNAYEHSDELLGEAL